MSDRLFHPSCFERQYGLPEGAATHHTLTVRPGPGDAMSPHSTRLCPRCARCGRPIGYGARYTNEVLMADVLAAL